MKKEETRNRLFHSLFPMEKSLLKNQIIRLSKNFNNTNYTVGYVDAMKEIFGDENIERLINAREIPVTKEEEQTVPVPTNKILDFYRRSYESLREYEELKISNAALKMRERILAYKYLFNGLIPKEEFNKIEQAIDVNKSFSQESEHYT